MGGMGMMMPSARAEVGKKRPRHRTARMAEKKIFFIWYLQWLIETVRVMNKHRTVGRDE
jgi:hypothetical protein